MITTFIGWDNGVSGSIGIINNDVQLFKTPIKNELSYTKVKQNISRIDFPKLMKLLEPFASDPQVKVWLERPLVNPTRFRATLSAIRALEATLIVLEELRISYEYVDSKIWQKALLPIGLKGSDVLKKASLDIGKRLFPSIDFKGYTDSDALLIAEFHRRKESK